MVDKPPLLLHVDVHKTIILGDSVMGKSLDYSVCEVVAQVFWGWIKPCPEEESPHGLLWTWSYDGKGPQAADPTPPPGEVWTANVVNKVDIGRPMKYAEFCRTAVKDKALQRDKIRSFELAGDVRAEMETVVADASNKMRLAPELRSPELAAETGLAGEWLCIFPSFLKMIAKLQRDGRAFSVCFRSFGNDHQKVRREWNAFCEHRHPLFNYMIDDIGTMDGKTPAVPNRCVGDKDTHTMYRDAQGPALALDVNTNGPTEGAWDQWSKSKAESDTRDGRNFLKGLGVHLVDGVEALHKWMVELVKESKSAAIKDDFAWWHYNGEVSQAAKLMPQVKDARSIFFDDNIGNADLSDAKIVDSRDLDFSPIAFENAFNKGLFKVNPLMAILDDDYFIKLVEAHDRASDE